MNLKTELKNLGYYLITPVPQKFHFEGVNNRRSAIQLTVLSALVPVAIFGGAAAYVEISARIHGTRVARELKAKYPHLYKK